MSVTKHPLFRIIVAFPLSAEWLRAWMSAGARGKAIDGGRRTFIVIVYGGRREHWATGASLPRNIVHDVDVLLYFMVYF